MIGSEALLARFPVLPEDLLISRVAQIFPRNRPDRASAIDYGIGDGSFFDVAYGYFARAVNPHREELPSGWQKRLVPLRSTKTGGATAWCLEIHDLVLARCVKGDQRDCAFAAKAVKHGLAHPERLRRRLSLLPDGDVRVRVDRMLDLFSRLG